jgi:uncharacterized protein with PIN domain
VDGHLGRLAAYLRVLGFDTWYRNHAADRELAERADRDDRVLLTRDRGLLKRSLVRRGYFVRSDQPTEQLAEVALRFGLDRSARPFGRCLRCNGVLEPVGRRRRRPFEPVRRSNRSSPLSRLTGWLRPAPRANAAAIEATLQTRLAARGG